MKSRVEKLSVKVLMLAVAQLCWPFAAAAQAFTPPAPSTQFDMNGVIQGATLDASCTADPLCGGTITINNQVITVPRNTILQMPAAALTWQEVFATAPQPYLGLGQTGLAMSDGNGTTIPPPPVQYEAQVVGNRVANGAGDQHIAGLIFLSQHSLSSSQGFINYIDYVNAELRVGGLMNDPNCVAGLATCTGQRVKINDPDGVYAAATRGILDVRFTIDANNPTIRTETGYPMCVPRNSALVDGVTGIPIDPECPMTNRPLDATQPFGLRMIFTMGPPQLVGGTLVGDGGDATKKAPLAVGDWVTYSGILIGDARGPYTAAYQIIANVGIFTKPGIDPAYIATDVMILGVGGVTVAGITEATARTRFEGFTTDPSRTVLLYGIDVDPCTGVQTPRSWGSIDVDPGPPTGAVMGRWRFRPPGKVLTMPPAGTFLPATREMRAALQKAGAAAGTPSDQFVTINSLGQTVTVPGSGFYQAPIFEFLFPENVIPGTPIVANNFEAVPFLVNGSGPLEGSGPRVGQLVQWPGQPVPAPQACPVAGVPFVTASGPTLPVTSGTAVSLAGTCTVDGVACVAPTFTWTQTDTTGFAGTNVTGQGTGTFSFTAPAVPFGPTVTLQYEVAAVEAGVTSNTALVAVTVASAITDTAQLSVGPVTYRQSKSRLTVNAGDSVTVPVGQPAPVLQAQSLDASGNPLTPYLTMTFAGAGLYTLDIRGTPQPTQVRVVSSYGGVKTYTLLATDIRP